MAIDPLNIATPQINSAFDFTPLMQLGKQYQQQQQDQQLASLGGVYGALPSDPTTAGPGSAPTAARAPFNNQQDLMANQGSNAKSWYDFAIKPAEAGGLGLTPAQAAGQVGNLQAESGSSIPSWGPTGDQGTAHGAAQWRLDRLGNLQKFSADRGLDYHSTEAQQAFMRHEYLGSGPYGGGSESDAYSALKAAQTPQAAASAVNRYYERSADRSGRREAMALRLHNWFTPEGQ